MKLIKDFCKEKRIFYKEEEPLANYTTLRIGGSSKLIVFPEEDTLRDLMAVIKNESIPYYIIGGGSNLLISDRGFRGVIINTRKMNRIEQEGLKITLSSGVMLEKVLAFLSQKKLSGMEGLIGIPGTIGGAIYGNAGSFGYEIKDCLQEITVIDEKLEYKTLKQEDINFSYRSSGLPKNFIITAACFKLKQENIDIVSKMKEFLLQKRLSQPLKERSAGCVFKNPDGHSAGYLIDKAGLKGTRIGDIVVSSLHANYFINVGCGKAEDFLKLMDTVKERVFKVFSIELEPEIKYLEG